MDGRARRRSKVADSGTGPTPIDEGRPSRAPAQHPITMFRGLRTARPGARQRSFPPVEEHARTHGHEVAVGDDAVGGEAADRPVVVDDAERAFERGRGRPAYAHPLFERAFQLHFTHAGL